MQLQIRGIAIKNIILNLTIAARDLCRIPGSHYYDPQLLDSFATPTQSYHDTVAGDYSIM